MSTHAKMSFRQPHPQNLAWKAKQTVIDDFLRTSLANKKTSVAYLKAAHGTGKSTTLLKHVYEVAQSVSEKPKITYVMSRAAETAALTKWLDESVGPGVFQQVLDTPLTPNIPFTVTSYNTFVGSMPQNPIREGILLVVDVELTPSLWGELVFGMLLAPTQSEDPAVTILLMAPHLSKRTVTAFEKVVGTMKIIDIQDPSPPLRVRYVQEDGNGWAETARAIIAKARARDAGAKALYCVPSNAAARDAVPNGASTLNLDLTVGTDIVIQRASDLLVDPHEGGSLQCPNLRLLVCMCSLESLAFDPMTSQIVQTKRRAISSDELDRQLSWALKTTHNPEDVEIIVLASRADV